MEGVDGNGWVGGVRGLVSFVVRNGWRGSTGGISARTLVGLVPVQVHLSKRRILLGFRFFSSVVGDILLIKKTCESTADRIGGI